MNALFLESARKILKDPSLQIYCDEAWGSQNPDHRKLIHARAAELKDARPDMYVSISHCEGMGAVAFSEFPVGADVEVSARVLEKIVARVSSDDEVKSAPSFSALWSAKEACFKALRSFDQPSVLSQISIGHWQNIDSQTETCRLTNAQVFNSPSENQGIVLHEAVHTYSFFIFRA